MFHCCVSPCGKAYHQLLGHAKRLGNKRRLWGWGLHRDMPNSFSPASVYQRVHAQSLSHIRLFVTPWTAAARLPCPWNCPGKNTRVGCHFLLQGIFPNPGIKPTSPALAGRFFTTAPPGKPPTHHRLKPPASLLHQRRSIGFESFSLSNTSKANQSEGLKRYALRLM